MKITVPFDSNTVDQEYGHRERRYEEKFEVMLPNGCRVESVRKKVRPSQTHLPYEGHRYPIKGEGYRRFIVIQ